MPKRQFCTPHLLSSGSATMLHRVSFDEKSFDEAWFQKLLMEQPTLLPVDEIEPLFGPLVPLARELPTPAGPVDVVYINSEGYLTLVETKLWRNPEARRQVVAQIIDYATAMSRWSYEDLCDAAKKSGAPGADPVASAVAAAPEFDRARFIDTVSRCLARGRFLLLIVGDGIQEGVEHLAETMAKSPHLGFSLALVELAMFRNGTSGNDYFLQPRTLIRTREVVRAVVELRAGISPKDVTVTLPSASDESKANRRHLPVEVFLEELAKTTSPDLAAGFQAFLRECESMGFELSGQGKTVGLYWFDPLAGARFFFGSIYANAGWIEVQYIPMYFAKALSDDTLAYKYIDALKALVPGSVVAKDAKAGKTWVRLLKGGYAVTIADLLPHAGAWMGAIRATMQEIEAAMSSRPSQTP